MSERRDLRRRHLLFYLRVFNTTSNQLLGWVVDLNAQGVMIISEKPIQTGQDYELKMDLPGQIGRKKTIKLTAESRWCRPDVNPDFYDIGFFVKEISDEDRQIIESMISFFGFQE
jgi:hypothetical protein